MQARTEGAAPVGLSTARAALRVAALLARSPRGVRADEVAEELAKSVSTAYNLLASLCAEGVAIRGAGGLYHLAPSFRYLVAEGPTRPAQERPELAALVEGLLARTHKRSYLAVLDDGRPRIVLERGLQGMPRVPGMDARLQDTAHALAVGKAVLAHAGPEILTNYLRAGLRGFTDRTVTTPEALLLELRDVRRSGVAAEREEFREDFCCLAAPVLDGGGGFVAAVGISMTRRGYEDEHEALAETLHDVAGAGFQACADPRELLGGPPSRPLASLAGVTEG